MNSLKNRVQLIGNLGMDPEIKELESGKKVARFSLATNSSIKKSNGDKVKNTQWHTIVAWDKTAEIIEKFTSKGSEVCVEGKINYKVYEDKNKIKKYITEIICTQVLLLN